MLTQLLLQKQGETNNPEMATKGWLVLGAFMLGLIALLCVKCCTSRNHSRENGGSTRFTAMNYGTELTELGDNIHSPRSLA